jgi:hypothetical protein
MGYSHNWYRPPVIADEVFQSIRKDFEKLILPLADFGVPLAGGNGRNEPTINNEEIRFNGVRDCGHPECEEIAVPYPLDTARGIGPSHDAIGDCDWVVRLKYRCCGGSCAHEAFALPKVTDREVTTSGTSDEPEVRGLVFYWTKTAFKPYDVAVTAALLIAKRYLHEQLVVHSNGLDEQWADAKELCQQQLGYGDWFAIIEDPRIEFWPGPNGTQVEREVRVRLLVEMDPAGFRL